MSGSPGRKLRPTGLAEVLQSKSWLRQGRFLVAAAAALSKLLSKKTTISPEGRTSRIQVLRNAGPAAFMTISA